jgi:hypothetical protein
MSPLARWGLGLGAKFSRVGPAPHLHARQDHAEISELVWGSVQLAGWPVSRRCKTMNV